MIRCRDSTNFYGPQYWVHSTSEVADNFGAELCLLHVMPLPSPELGAAAFSVEDYMRESRAEGEEQISTVVAERIPKTVKTRALYAYGNAADEIERAAQNENADLLVIATHGLTGWRHFVFGSVAEKAVRTAPCPVLVIPCAVSARPRATLIPLRRILCPTDYSEPSYAALKEACELAVQFGAELHVLHVVPTLSETLEPGVYIESDYDLERLAVDRNKLNELVAERVPKEVKTCPSVRLGNAAEEIAHAAAQQDVDLFVMATHGLTGWRHMVFGSVTERVLRSANCPILVIHASAR